MIQTYRFSDVGAPALLLHCALGRAQDWRSLLGAMQTPLASQGFDMPGHGASACWDGADPHVACVAQAGRMMDAPTVVIGHSFGATIALRLALEQVGRVRALILIEPVLFAAARGAPSYAALRAQDDAFTQMMAQGRHNDAAAEFLGLWGAGMPFAALPERDQDRLAAQMPFIAATAATLYDDAAHMLGEARLEKMRLPVLLLHGTRSPPIVADIVNALAARLPNAQTQSIEGAAHMLPITHPDATARRIDHFLGRVLA